MCSGDGLCVSTAPGSTPQQRLPLSVQGVDAESEAFGPLVLIDTAGCEMEETADQDSDSKLNEGEAKVSSAYPGLPFRLYQECCHQTCCMYHLQRHFCACCGAEYSCVWVMRPPCEFLQKQEAQ